MAYREHECDKCGALCIHVAEEINYIPDGEQTRVVKYPPYYWCEDCEIAYEDEG